MEPHTPSGEISDNFAQEYWLFMDTVLYGDITALPDDKLRLCQRFLSLLDDRTAFLQALPTSAPDQNWQWAQDRRGQIEELLRINGVEPQPSRIEPKAEVPEPLTDLDELSA